eukprot:380719_1
MLPTYLPEIARERKKRTRLSMQGVFAFNAAEVLSVGICTLLLILAPHTPILFVKDGDFEGNGAAASWNINYGDVDKPCTYQNTIPAIDDSKSINPSCWVMTTRAFSGVRALVVHDPGTVPAEKLTVWQNRSFEPRANFQLLYSAWIANFDDKSPSGTASLLMKFPGQEVLSKTLLTKYEYVTINTMAKNINR